MTGIIKTTGADASIANIPMLYLLVVIGAALLLGRAAAILASIASFFSFDYFFVAPRYQLTVQEPAEWLALCIFLLTATVTGQLMALLRARAEEAQRRKLETAALAEASWAVASELDRDVALRKVLSRLAEIVRPEEAALLAPDDKGECHAIAKYRAAGGGEEAALGIAGDAIKFVLAEGRSIGWDKSRHWQKALGEADRPSAAYLPIVTENQVLGVLYLRLPGTRRLVPIEMQVVDSLANHAAVLLQRDRLMKAQARAQALAEADRLKTALLSMVSHDFRSPLTSIKASVSSILEDGSPVDPEVQRGLLQGVVQETDRLNRMVGNILDLSRLESGAWQPLAEPTSVAELVGAALDCFGKEENERIHVELDRAVAEVTVDAVQMVQVLKNLLENSLKYSPPGSAVELATHWQDGLFVLEVLDCGPGLPRGDEQRVFEPFYRAPGWKESAVPGVGIGLALCRGLVEANGGHLSALNREGGGCVFRVTLPHNETSQGKQRDPS